MKSVFRRHQKQDQKKQHLQTPQNGLQSADPRHLQKVDIAQSISEPPAVATTNTIQDPLPFQQSVTLCPDSDNMVGYATLRALRDDLRVYFEIVHGVPPPPRPATTEGTAIPPPDFGTMATTVGGTGVATVGSTAMMDGIVSTTGATATDTLFSTAAGAVATDAAAGDPVVRKRTRSHGHRRLQDDIDEVVIMNVDSTTSANVAPEAYNATDLAVTTANEWDANATTGPLSTVSYTEESANLTILAETAAALNGDNTPSVNVAFEAYNTSDLAVTPNEWDANVTTGSLSTISYAEESANPTIVAESTAASNLSTDFEIEPSIPVQFNICPGVFDFESLLDKDPIVLEALTHNPVWIRCMADNEAACVFSGGRHHISFNNHGATNSTEEEVVIHPLTISGVSFREAALSAISMHDPRGEIVFDNCEFSKNKGAAIVVNGRYEGTHTAYYDFEVDDGIVADGTVSDGSVSNSGGSNPIISGGNDVNEDDILQQFYEDVITPAPITANPSPAPNTEPTTEAPITPIPTTALRIQPMPTSSPVPTLSLNLLNPIPERGGYTGPPTLPEEETETSSTEGSFLLPTTTGSGTTAFVNPSTTWAGNLGSTTTTHSTTYSSSEPFEGDDFVSVENDEENMDDGFRRKRTRGKGSTRFLEVDSAPKSIIKLQSCHFHGNTGSATILMTSHYGEMETTDAGVLEQTDDVFSAATGSRSGDIPMAHSIHMALENTMFDSENVKRSVIINDGARLQSSKSMFVKNTADSIIHVESGTVAMTQTEFSENTITGDAGLVEMDDESTLESNDNNCDGSSSSQIESVIYEDAPISSRSLQDNATDIMPEIATTSEIDGAPEPIMTSPGASPSSTCAGIYSDGMCRKFGDSCDVEENEILVPQIPGCVSTWDDLVTVVEERLNDERDFVICPQSTLEIDTSTSQSPIVIDSDYITIRCGETGSLSDQCSIVGGFTQFRVVGSAAGIELAGLKMLSARGSSILASGTKDSTLRLKNCEWLSNTGASTVLVHGEAATGASMDDLDVSQLMSTTSESAMSIEINNCIFRKNSAMFGTISNIGGTLTVYKTLFDDNFAKGGDIVLTNKGSGKVGESCFDSSSSTLPGAIFVEFGSFMSANTNNFGINNTSIGGQCSAIFQESEGASCLSNPAMCTGSCMEFTSTSCSLPMYDKFIDGPVSSNPAPPPVLAENAPSDKVAQPNTSNNLIPIIVATLVAAFIVFGLAGIIWHRKKKGKGNTGESGGTGRQLSRFGGNPFVRLRRSKNAQEEELNEAYDGFDDLDEEGLQPM